jgi:creatinine amidohydrolase
MSSYYADHERGANPFNWISGHPLMDAEIISQYPFDHAAIGETSLMMELLPESVDMTYLDTSKWYLETAKDANRELGAKGASLVLERMRKILTESRLAQP